VAPFAIHIENILNCAKPWTASFPHHASALADRLLELLVLEQMGFHAIRALPLLSPLGFAACLSYIMEGYSGAFSFFQPNHSDISYEFFLADGQLSVS
jgi:hypothetical protein